MPGNDTRPAMKTALFITDCSVDAALALRNRIGNAGAHTLALTVVHPYEIDASQPLTKTITKEARQQAQERLRRWANLFASLDLPGNMSLTVKTELLFASPELAATIHQALRSYDYLFTEAVGEDALAERVARC